MSTVLLNTGKNSILTKQTEYNPFPGLRPFRQEESHLFFGRSGQSEEVIDKLSKNKFVAVIGASGSGKSSLLYCGVMPILHGGFVQGASSKWKIITTRPGGGPINNLAKAIVKSSNPNIKDDSELNESVALNSAILRTSANGLLDVAKNVPTEKGENILILVDQFEELFRYKNNNKDQNGANESVAFIKLLLNAVKNENSNVYVVMTMRSDFIGECAQFQELTRLINESQYLIPRMSRQDMKEAIEGPISVGGGKISSRLVNQLLNEIGDNQDQLPILQHALMRTWDYWTKFKSANEPIDNIHYESIGRMEKALSEHANEAYDELTLRGKEICLSIFKTLTERGADNRGVRRPTKLSEIAKIALCEEKEVTEIYQNFRKKGRSFLTSADSTLTSNSIIDVSHESLMRIWDRLIVWVEEEANAVNMYLRISEAAALYQAGQTGLWRPPDLQLALKWREQQKPTITWAQRHNLAFERTMSYLEASEVAYIAEEKNKVKLQKKALRRSRIFAIVVGTAAIFLSGVLVWAFQQKVEADKNLVLAKENEVQAKANAKEALANAEEAKLNLSAAEKAQKEADLNALEAMRSAEEAKQNLILADEHATQAEKNLAIAKLNELAAKKASIEAEKSALLAQKNAEEALKQKSKADQSSEQALNLRMLSIAQSMAVKSQQIRRNKEKRALIAYQGYLFNKNYGGETHHGDVYSGLYGVLGEYFPEDYNNMKGHTAGVRAVVYESTSDVIYSTGSDGVINQWSSRDSFKTPKEFPTSTGSIKRSLISNSNWLVTGTESSKILVLSKADQKETVLKGHSKPVWALDFGTNNSLVSASADSSVIWWNLTDGTSTIIEKSNTRFKSVKVSPNKRYIVGAAENGKVIQWDINNNFQAKIIFFDNSRSLTDVAFNKKGDKIAIGDKSGLVSIIDLNSSKIEAELIGQTARITQLKFSENDHYLASASYDGTVQVFLTENYDLSPLVLSDHDTWVNTLAFTDNDTKLITGCMDGELKVYPTSMEKMAEDIKGMLTRNMTQKEWEKFVAKDISYKKTNPNL